MIVRVLLLGLFLLLPSLRAQTAAGGGGHYDPDGAPLWRSELPDDLAEISGLDFAPDGRLLAHGDEQALIWILDPKTRQVEGRFGLVGPAGLLRADFEDLQVLEDRLFLLTSDAEIYESRIGADGATLEARRRVRGLGRSCEAEGMTYDEATQSLLLLCKDTRSKKWKDQVVVVAVSTEDWRFEKKPRLTVPFEQLEAVTGEKRFNGSALARHPRTGNYLMVAGPQRAFAEVTASGQVVGGTRLDKDRHRQPEGIAIAPDLTLLISDEASGREATITAYAYRP